jgi:hypothetical protein
MIVKQRTARASKKSRPCGKCHEQILPEQEYYSWAFRYGGRHFRHVACGYPPRSALTQSKIGEVYAAIESAEDELRAVLESGVAVGAEDEVHAILELVGEEAARIAEEYRDAAENFGGAGENAERADELESYARECDGFSPTCDVPEVEEGEEADTEAVEQYLSELCQEAQDVLDNFSL